MNRLRIALAPLVGHIIRILIYARYSTEEQHPSSIEDQFALCEQFLADNSITEYEIQRFDDRELSGELVSRPGIDQVREGIHSRRWDLIVVEDSSRLFRHVSACGQLIEAAVDRNIRVICLNDGVDTAEDDWQERLYDAQRHHARSNRDTAKRIKRKLDGLWRNGASIGLLRPGYKRRASTPATQREPEQGPFFDEIDEQWAGIIREAYERVAAGIPAWQVASRLSEVRLPKCSNSHDSKWSEKNVIALIQRTVYRGVEEYRKTIVKKNYSTGCHEQIRNEKGKSLTRDMPHLRIVSDDLWYRANEAIRRRTLRSSSKSGHENPLTGIPRDSRGPLSGIFVCHICSGKMHVDGRNGGAYRCSNVRKGTCWNKATAKCEVAHSKIGGAVLEQLLLPPGVMDAIIEQVRKVLLDDQSINQELADLQNTAGKLENARDRLINFIETSAESLPSLVERLKQREVELERTRAQIEEVRRKVMAKPKLPEREEIVSQINDMKDRILTMDRESAVLLRRLVTPIRAVPFRQFGSNLVVLRARFEMRLIELLPTEILGAIRGNVANDLADRLRTPAIEVDLFERSDGPNYFAQALAHADSEYSLIGNLLGISDQQASRAIAYGRALRGAGLDDPYQELTEMPQNASRWRVHAKFKKGM